MDRNTAQSLIEFITAAGIVTLVAVGIGCVAWGASRRAGQPFCPRWKTPGVSWAAAAILLSLFPAFFVGFQVALTVVVGLIDHGQFPNGIKVTAASEKATVQLRQLWATVLVTPIFLVLYSMAKRLIGATKPMAFARNIFIGVVGWAVLMPLTFGVHALVGILCEWFGIPPTPHPLMDLSPADDGTNGVLFALGVCLCTPIIEECLFRGLLVPWAGQRWMFPWVLMFAALLLVLLASPHPMAPALFVAFLCGMLFLIQMFAPRKHIPRRTTAAIIASSTAFVAAHSGVWPTPIPLFVLACGLGYLTARTRSIVPAVVVHGLFNAVSFVMLCRGSAI